MIRSKFECISVTKRKNWNAYVPGGTVPPAFVYDYEFLVVTGGSEENEKFFASTPSGNVRLSAVRDDLFQPREFYYLDFTPVE